ncbi:uncharacterized protein K444DRAFT_713362, partial [Hyaloscypha bicolor E]
PNSTQKKRKGWPRPPISIPGTHTSKNLRLRVNSGSNYASGKRIWLAAYHKTPKGASTRSLILIRRRP